jgi:hypothetical protein
VEVLVAPPSGSKSLLHDLMQGGFGGGSGGGGSSNGKGSGGEGSVLSWAQKLLGKMTGGHTAGDGDSSDEHFQHAEDVTQPTLMSRLGARLVSAASATTSLSASGGSGDTVVADGADSVDAAGAAAGKGAHGQPRCVPFRAVPRNTIGACLKNQMSYTGTY